MLYTLGPWQMDNDWTGRRQPVAFGTNLLLLVITLETNATFRWSENLHNDGVSKLMRKVVMGMVGPGQGWDGMVPNLLSSHRWVQLGE